MSTTIDKAIFAVPEFGNRISLFIQKLRIAQYSEGTITNYCHHIAKAVAYLRKIPDDFLQVDVDDYLSMLINHPRHYSESFFKHTVFGLKDYYKFLGIEEPKGIYMPAFRKKRTLAKIFSQNEIIRLITPCDLYSKTLLSLTYDCGLRAFEIPHIKWCHINFDRRTLLVEQGKGRKDRYVPISDQMLKLLKIYRMHYPSDEYVFKSRGQDPQPITNSYIRTIFKSALNAACLDHSMNFHSLRHSHASHILEMGESIIDVKTRLGHTNINTTLGYLHVIDKDPQEHVRPIDVLFPPRNLKGCK
jgi:integrase/recombinase XerD